MDGTKRTDIVFHQQRTSNIKKKNILKLTRSTSEK